MDYSTISNKTNITESEELTDAELHERYYSLKKQFDGLSHSYEVTKQELYDTKRTYQTVLDVHKHVSAEAETFQAEEQKKKIELNNRITSLQEEIAQLREERSETVDRHATEVKKLEEQIKFFKEEQAFKARESPVRDNSELEEAKAILNTALDEAATAKAALEDAKAEILSWRLKIEELMREMAEVRAAADLCREEMRTVSEREAATLDELAEAKAMLHQYMEPQDLQPHAAKGNSIFAEVEDKRQEMAKNLIQMKQTNSRLRRELANKQSEVDALLHEKQTIWEQQSGASAHYDGELIESYEERITQLEGVCEKQRRETARWFRGVSESAPHGWLPAVLLHLQSEVRQLRAEVVSGGAARLAAAAQLRDLRRKLALHAVTAHKHSASPADNDTTDNIPLKPLKMRAIEDVKKKVSFN